MKYLDLDYILKNLDFIIEEIRKGKIFIYPTDTVLGIGCDARNDDSVSKIFEIKKRDNKPFLIIVPNFNWIIRNCDINNDKLNFIENKLPGPYSFILKLKKNNFLTVSKKVISDNNTIGIRIPNCDFSRIVEEFGFPFITTSVNISGEKSAVNLNKVDDDILKKVDYVIDGNFNLTGNSSTIYDLTGDDIIKIR